MQVIRIMAIEPPTANRSAWARKSIEQALALNLAPAPYPAHKASSFTVTLKDSTADKLQELAKEQKRTKSQVACGLIQALAKQQEKNRQNKIDKKEENLPGQDRVRPALTHLLEQSNAGMQAGKVVFAEAATGTGKGNMIAALASAAVQRGQNAVIAAPLAVTWNLLNNLAAIEQNKNVKVRLVLGRANFISPQRTLEWAKEHEHDQLIQWIDDGAKPQSDKLIAIGKQLGYQLCYLLEQALALAPDMPVDYCMLDADDDPEQCPAEQIYLRQRENCDQAAIIVCSHHMLAAVTQLRMLKGNNLDSSLALPDIIDNLIVDEAHMLESAFSAITQHSLRMRPLIRAIKKDVKTGRTQAIKTLEALYDALRSNDSENSSKQIGQMPDVKNALLDAQQALSAIKLNNLPPNTRMLIRLSVQAMNSSLNNYSRVRIDLSPVKRYPMLISGRSSLKGVLAHLWDNAVGVTLTSATLYTDADTPNLIRWKMEVPQQRCLFLPSVHPGWVTRPVTLHRTLLDNAPDDSPEWADECASQVIKIARKASGGTLVLCTSFLNVDQLAKKLSSALPGRLVVQSHHQGATICEMLYRNLHEAGAKPVWLGLGAAWTGIDLSDHKEQPENDQLLTDLVITRLPVGLNRTLTHERRVRLGGFRVTAQEAVWQFRQGVGRLVRREGVRSRNLWLLDKRIDDKAGWLKGFRTLLARYKDNQ